jgi:hypothetical protein
VHQARGGIAECASTVNTTEINSNLFRTMPRYCWYLTERSCGPPHHRGPWRWTSTLPILEAYRWPDWPGGDPRRDGGTLGPSLVPISKHHDHVVRGRRQPVQGFSAFLGPLRRGGSQALAERTAVSREPGSVVLDPIEHAERATICNACGEQGEPPEVRGLGRGRDSQLARSRRSSRKSSGPIHRRRR